jgi:hypothetical protein
MNERGRLQSVVGALPFHLVGGEPAQFGISLRIKVFTLFFFKLEISGYRFGSHIQKKFSIFLALIKKNVALLYEGENLNVIWRKQLLPEPVLPIAGNNFNEEKVNQIRAECQHFLNLPPFYKPKRYQENAKKRKINRFQLRRKNYGKNDYQTYQRFKGESG